MSFVSYTKQNDRDISRAHCIDTALADGGYRQDDDDIGGGGGSGSSGGGYAIINDACHNVMNYYMIMRFAQQQLKQYLMYLLNGVRKYQVPIWITLCGPVRQYGFIDFGQY